MPNTWSGAFYPGGSDNPNIPADMLSAATAVSDKIIGKYADANARNAATTGFTSLQKQGVQAYLADRETYCTWSPTDNAWIPMPVFRVLRQDTLSTNVDLRAGVDTYTKIMEMTGITLPPGNRWIRIGISVRAQNIATGASVLAAVPRISLVSAGVGTVGQAAGLIEGYQPAGDTVPITLSRTWLFQTAGNYAAAVYAYPAGNYGGYVRFSSGTLDITDLGSV